ncbi:MAG: hypothetical protein M1833_003938 [Piccolia ochrophora]|nr:MAG: hypothetical protein M1833_003938 [Piccolia ochrophora]
MLCSPSLLTTTFLLTTVVSALDVVLWLRATTGPIVFPPFDVDGETMPGLRRRNFIWEHAEPDSCFSYPDDWEHEEPSRAVGFAKIEFRGFHGSSRPRRAIGYLVEPDLPMERFLCWAEGPEKSRWSNLQSRLGGMTLFANRDRTEQPHRFGSAMWEWGPGAAPAGPANAKSKRSERKRAGPPDAVGVYNGTNEIKYSRKVSGDQVVYMNEDGEVLDKALSAES